MVVRMQKGNMRIPRCARGNAESERMVFRQTEIIRMSFIYKSERARRISVPGVGRYYLQSRSQLRLKDLFRFGLVSWRDHGRHITPREIHTRNDLVVQTEGADQACPTHQTLGYFTNRGA
jgi:hypothetical protein